MEIEGKNVFITGASKGIGKSVAEALLVKKAKVNLLLPVHSQLSRVEGSVVFGMLQ